jgi:hypothetical protein
MRALLIGTHQPAVTGYIGGENGSQLAFDAFRGQSGAPRPHGPNGLSALGAHSNGKREGWHSLSVKRRIPLSSTNRVDRLRPCCLPWISVLSSSNPVLITDLADLSVREIDLKHVFRRPDHADRGMCTCIENFGSIRAIFIGSDITVIALNIEGQPM